MADLQTLQDAFMKADAAGDTESAQALATEIKRQRAMPTQQAQDTIRHPLDTSSLTPDSPAVPWYAPITYAPANALDMATNFGKMAYNQAGHVFDTVDTPIGKVPLGPMGPIVANLKSGYQIGSAIAQNPQATANGIRQAVSDNLGTPTRAWNTIATHPIDTAMMFAPALGMAGKAADAAGFADTAAGLAKAADMTNPVNLAVKPIVNYGPAVAKTVAAPAYGYYNPQGMADSIFNNAITKAGQTPADLLNSVKSAIAEGQPQFTNADALGLRGQELLASVARSPNDMQQTISDTLLNRQAGQSGRVAGFVKDGLDAQGTADQLSKGLKKLRGMVADSNYAAAKSNAGPVDLGGTINKIDELVGPNAKFDAGISPDSTESALLSLRDRLATGDKRGLIARSDFENLLSTKGDLKDTIDSLYQNGKTNRANALNAVYKQLDAALSDASSSYRNANDTFAQMSRPIDAIGSGVKAARPSSRAADTVQQFAGMAKDPASQMAFKVGYADPLLGQIERTPWTSNAARPLMTDKHQAEFGVMAKDPALLNRQLGRENTMNATMQRATGGSKTDMNLMNEAGLSSVSPSDLFHAATGGIGGMVNFGLRAGSNFLTGRNSTVRSLLAKQLLENNGARNIRAKPTFSDKDKKWIKALIAGRASSSATAPQQQ